MPVLKEDGRLHDDRDARGDRVGLQPVQHFVAVHVEENEVKHDRIDWLPCEPQSVAPGRGLTYVEASRREGSRHAVAGVGAVIHHKDDVHPSFLSWDALGSGGNVAEVAR